MGRFDTFSFLPCRDNDYGYKRAQQQDREKRERDRKKAHERRAEESPKEDE